jgi:hypothetical protein
VLLVVLVLLVLLVLFFCVAAYAAFAACDRSAPMPMVDAEVQLTRSRALVRVCMCVCVRARVCVRAACLRVCAVHAAMAVRRTARVSRTTLGAQLAGGCRLFNPSLRADFVDWNPTAARRYF